MLADGADVDEGVLADVGLQPLELGGAVVTEMAAEGSLSAVDHRVAVPVHLVLKFAIADLAVIEKLSLALSRLQANLIVSFLHFPIGHIVNLTYVFEEIFDVGVLFLAEATVSLDFLVHPLNMYLQVPLTEAAEGAVLAAKPLARVLAHVDAQVGLDGAGIVTLRALEWLLFGVNPQMGLKRVLEFEHLVAVLTREDLQLSLCKPREVKSQKKKHA